MNIRYQGILFLTLFSGIQIVGQDLFRIKKFWSFKYKKIQQMTPFFKKKKKDYLEFSTHFCAFRKITECIFKGATYYRFYILNCARFDTEI